MQKAGNTESPLKAGDMESSLKPGKLESPLKLGDMETIEIIDLGTTGDGIGRFGGMAVFVPGTIPGDCALVEITQVKKNVAKGVLRELTIPSAYRVKDQCPYGSACGGCSLRQMSYQGQLALKGKWVKDRLIRIGNIPNPPVRPVMGMECDHQKPGPWRYRNKASYPVGRVNGADKKNKACNIGFHRLGTNEIIDCQTCLLQTEAAEVAAQIVRQYVKEEKLPIYDRKTGTGTLRHVVVRTAFGTGEVMVILVSTQQRLPHTERLILRLNEAINDLSDRMRLKMKEEGGQGFFAGLTPDEQEFFAEEIPDQEPALTGQAQAAVSILQEEEDFGYSLESVILNVNKKKTPQILGTQCITLAGTPTIRDFMCGMEFEISPLAFYQVNPVQTERLYAKVKEYAGLTGQETVLDLYCGVGIIGLYLADQAKQVIGIESVKSAVLDANRNATINGIVNARYICGRAEEILPALIEKGELSGLRENRLCDLDVGENGKKHLAEHADVVILDPPRSGCERPLLEAVLDVCPKRIVYVSCDPATLARDVKVLTEGGYELIEAQPVDMFAFTMGVEVVCFLVRKG